MKANVSAPDSLAPHTLDPRLLQALCWEGEKWKKKENMEKWPNVPCHPCRDVPTLSFMSLPDFHLPLAVSGAMGAVGSWGRAGNMQCLALLPALVAG